MFNQDNRKPKETSNASLSSAWKLLNEQIEAIEASKNKKYLENEKKYLSSLGRIQSDYTKALEGITGELTLINFEIGEKAWDSDSWQKYEPSIENFIPRTIRIGDFFYKGVYNNFRTPAILPIIGSRKNILIKAKGSGGKEAARRLIQSITLRLVYLFPTGKLRLTCIDPVGPGITSAGFIKHLPQSISGGQAWFETRHIEDELSKIEVHKANVIQKYLGVMYQDIEQFNRDAGQVEEPYRLLIISDFPIRFSESAAQTLASIASNGPSIGVYSIILLDVEAPPIYNFNIGDLEKISHIIYCNETGSYFEHPVLRKCKLILDEPPPPEKFLSMLQAVDREAKEIADVKVNFLDIIPERNKWWQGDSSKDVSVPIGQFGAREKIILSFDHKLLSSALVIGRQGSGKSTLLHTIVTAFSIFYSPIEIDLYLLDMKQVEFKVYANNKLPHARVIAIQADREFALSVLRKVNSEINDRETKFRDADAVNLESYRKKTKIILPRIILVIDEFQEIFNPEDEISREASIILDRTVKLGRAFGVNLILASQSLRGYTFSNLDSATKDLIPIRIGLQCSDLDARIVMSDDNNQASLLERPGEAIYNALNGRIEGNKRFQVYWVEEEYRNSLLKEISDQYLKISDFQNLSQIIFDGKATIPLNSNKVLEQLLKTPTIPIPQRNYHAWLGESVDIKPHISAVFRQQSGSNLLILGQREHEKTIYSLITSCLISLAAQHSEATAEFCILNFSDLVENENLDSYVNNPNLFKVGFPFKTLVVETRNKVVPLIKSVYKELQKRIDGEDRSSSKKYIVIIGLHSIKDIRWVPYFEPDDNTPLPPSYMLAQILKDGPDYGFHTICWCDTQDNFNRAIDSSTLSEFDMRIALNMNADNSRWLLDNNEIASKLDGNRCVYIDVERMHIPEKFRPYVMPLPSEIQSIGLSIKNRA